MQFNVGVYIWQVYLSVSDILIHYMYYQLVLTGLGAGDGVMLECCMSSFIWNIHLKCMSHLLKYFPLVMGEQQG